MMHVGVYPEHRGQGVAGKVTQAALEYAKGKSLRVIPMCSYVGAYIRRNPEYIELTKQHQLQKHRISTNQPIQIFQDSPE